MQIGSTSSTAALLCVLLFLGGVFAFGSHSARAQDDPNRPVLPDIAPRVVEIRGQLEISMPSLERQPLMGFNPPPPVAPIPPDRRPFIEEYKQESIDLPPSPLEAPEPPSVSSLISRQPRNGIVEAAAGRYFSRMVRFRTEWPLGEPTAVYSRFDYDGSDGHEPIDERPEADAAYDALDALVGFQYRGGAAAAGVEIGGFINNYLLYALEPTASSGNVLADEPPDREGRGGGIAAWLRSRAGGPAEVNARVHYGTSLYHTLAASTDAGTQDLFETEEATLDATGDLRVPFAEGQFFVADARFTGIGRGEDAVGTTVRMLDAAGGLKVGFARGLDVTARGRIMSYSSGDHKLVAGEMMGGSDGTFVSLDALANLYPAEGFRLYVQNRPRAEHHTLTSLLRENPFLVDGPIVQPTVYTIDARGGAHLVKGIFEAEVFAGYQRAPNFLYFTRSTNDESYGYGGGLITTRYDEAEIVLFGGDVSVNLPAGLNGSIGITVRDGRLTEEDSDIPYFGPLIGRGALSYSFADGRGFVQATGQYEAARYVALPGGRKLGDFFDLDLEGTYDLTSSIGAVVHFRNLSAGYLERWEGFERPPFVLMGGLRLRW